MFLAIFCRDFLLSLVQKNSGFLKKPNPLGFGGFIGFWASLFFGFFIQMSSSEAFWLISLIS